MYYATHEVFDHFSEGPQLFAFKTRRARDSFVEHGPRGAWGLVYPFEQKPVTAKDAKALARVDGFGDKYAINGDSGGVLYVWGAPNYERAQG